MSGSFPLPPVVAEEIFGERIGLAVRYAEILTGAGIARGVLGPRERERIWDRHLVNCVLIGELLPQGAGVVDVGSGAGLPGLALACGRADLRLDLVEAQERRVAFLRECVDELDLGGSVRVFSGRAESREVLAAVGGAQWVTARALAPLDRLAQWCLPLLAPGGRLLAMKGGRAQAEVSEHAALLRRLGAVVESVQVCGAGRVIEPATVVVIGKR